MLFPWEAVRAAHLAYHKRRSWLDTSHRDNTLDTIYTIQCMYYSYITAAAIIVVTQQIVTIHIACMYIQTDMVLWHCPSLIALREAGWPIWNPLPRWLETLYALMSVVIQDKVQKIKPCHKIKLTRHIINRLLLSKIDQLIFIGIRHILIYQINRHSWSFPVFLWWHKLWSHIFENDAVKWNLWYIFK